MSDAYLVRRGGSGGLSPNSAVIHVTAPAGSTISFEKGGVVAKVLGPGKQHISFSDSSFAEWYYAIAPHHFGSWTITGTNSEGSISQTITVNDVKEYDVIISFGRLYWEGNEYVGVTGGWGVAQATYKSGLSYREVSVTKNSDSISLSSYRGNDTEGCFATANKIELTRYRVLKVNVTGVWSTASWWSYTPNLVVSSANSGRVSASAAVQLSTNGVISLDVSSLSGNYYILIFLGYYGNAGCGMSFNKVWLEA